MKVLYAQVAEPGLICRPLLHLVTCVQVWRCDVWGVRMEGEGCVEVWRCGGVASFGA